MVAVLESERTSASGSGNSRRRFTVIRCSGVLVVRLAVTVTSPDVMTRLSTEKKAEAHVGLAGEGLDSCAVAAASRSQR